MVHRFNMKSLANSVKSCWAKFHAFFVNKYETIYRLKDMFHLSLPGFDKSLILNTLSKEIMNCRLKSKSLTILIIEIDYFNHYIETFGVEAGKKLINSVKEIIDKKTRDSDLSFNDNKGKFIIFLPEALQEEVLNIASRVRDIVTKQGYTPYDGTEQIKIKLTVSIGSAYSHCFNGNEKLEAVTLLKKAQSALLEGKKKGINQIHLGQ